MSEQKTDVQQLCGILDQFDKATIMSAVQLAVPRADLIQLGGGANVPSPLVIPPVILFPGGSPAATPAEGGRQVTSKDCGPKRVKGIEKGNWDKDKETARESARMEARKAAEGSCRPKTGGCPDNKKCTYLETDTAIVGPEERQNPTNPNEPQYRYEFTTEGTCQCE